ncbi:unnamed protein product, partial [Symbiodinium microadriaticum]
MIDFGGVETNPVDRAHAGGDFPYQEEVEALPDAGFRQNRSESEDSYERDLPAFSAQSTEMYTQESPSRRPPLAMEPRRSVVHERALPPRESAIAGSLDLSSVLDIGAGRGYPAIYSYSVLSFSPRLPLCSLAYIVVMFARVESQSQPGLDDSEHNGMMPAAGGLDRAATPATAEAGWASEWAHVSHMKSEAKGHEIAVNFVFERVRTEAFTGMLICQEELATRQLGDISLFVMGRNGLRLAECLVKWTCGSVIDRSVSAKLGDLEALIGWQGKDDLQMRGPTGAALSQRAPGARLANGASRTDNILCAVLALVK